MAKHICDPKCIYFPQYSSKIKKEYIDAFGVKHRDACHMCGYDDHRIEKFIICEHYRGKVRSSIEQDKKDEPFLYDENNNL